MLATTSDERERRRSAMLLYVSIASLTARSFTDLYGVVKDIA